MSETWFTWWLILLVSIQAVASMYFLYTGFFDGAVFHGVMALVLAGLGGWLVRLVRETKTD